MIHRTTFTLDAQTVETIKKLATLWQVPQAEVVRRSIASAASELSDRKQVIQKLLDYWTFDAIEQESPTNDLLETYLQQVIKDRKNWRTNETN